MKTIFRLRIYLGYRQLIISNVNGFEFFRRCTWEFGPTLEISKMSAESVLRRKIEMMGDVNER